MPRTISAFAAVFVCALACALASAQAQAAEKLRVGKAVPQAFSFVPLDVGIRKGFFKDDGVEIEEYAFGGDAKMQQAMTAGSIDIGVGSGPGMAFIVKGAPVRAVAAMAGPPLILTLIVRPDGAKSVGELKGKKISVSTPGSLTYWLVSETSRQQGWGPNGIDIAPMGAMGGQIAALERGDIDGVVSDVSTALDLVKLGKARILIRFGNIVKDFQVHVIYATNTLIAARPDAVRGFLKGWFQAIAFMLANKAETVAIGMDVLQKDADIMNQTYDELMPMFSKDGRFNQKGLETLANSWVELKILPQAPDLKTLYTEAYLPSAAK